MDLLIIIFFGVLGLSIIVLIHELGHYFAAKICGVGVETFSIGFGKEIFSFTRNDTKYRISWILLGGYCKLKGEMFKPNFTEQEFEEAKKVEGSFLNSPPLKKIFISAAGPGANVIFGALIFSIISFIGFNIPTFGTRIVLQADYPLDDPNPVVIAKEAGLETGDTILAINEKEVNNFYEIRQIIVKSAGDNLVFQIDRNGEILERTIVPEDIPDKFEPRIGIHVWIAPIIDKVKKGSSFQIGGLKQGDIIVSVNDIKIEHTVAFSKILHDKSKVLNITYKRDGELYSTVCIPRYEKDEIETGISFKHITIRSPRVDPFSAVLQGISRTGKIFSLIIKSFAYLFRVGVKDVSDVVAGPIRIIQNVGNQALVGFNFGIGEGITNFLSFICFLGILLAFMNLLPIPILDGGQIVLAIIMGIKREMGPKFIYRYQLVGFSIIAMLTLLAIFSDIFYLIRF